MDDRKSDRMLDKITQIKRKTKIIRIDVQYSQNKMNKNSSMDDRKPEKSQTK